MPPTAFGGRVSLLQDTRSRATFHAKRCLCRRIRMAWRPICRRGPVKIVGLSNALRSWRIAPFGSRASSASRSMGVGGPSLYCSGSPPPPTFSAYRRPPRAGPAPSLARTGPALSLARTGPTRGRRRPQDETGVTQIDGKGETADNRRTVALGLCARLIQPLDCGGGQFEFCRFDQVGQLRHVGGASDRGRDARASDEPSQGDAGWR